MSKTGGVCRELAFSRGAAALALLVVFLVAPTRHPATAAEPARLPAAAEPGAASILTYAAPVAARGTENRYTLRVRGTALELSDSASGAVLRSRPLAATAGVDIRGADGDTNDTLTVDLGGGLLALPQGIRYDGGTGGFDTLVVAGGAVARQTYDQKNANDGVITLDGLRIVYTNIEPIHDVVPAGTLTINATAGADAISIVDGPILEQTTVSSPSFELITFANKANVVVNGLGGNDTVTLNNPHPAAGMMSLTINGGTEDDSIVVVASPPGVTVNVDGGDGDDTLTVNGSEGILDNLRYLPTALGQGHILNDSGPNAIANFSAVEHLLLVGNAGDGDGFRIDGSIGNDLIGFFHGATPGSGTFQGTMDQNNATGVGPFALTETRFQGGDPAANDLDVNFFNPGGSDSFEFNGTTGDDVIAVGGGEAGGVLFTNTLGGTLYSRLEVFNTATLNVKADLGNDTITVTPHAAVELNIDGGGGTDTLVGPDQANAWNITGVDQGNVAGLVASYTAVENLTGGTAADSFSFAGAGEVSGLLDGGTGDDSIVVAGNAGLQDNLRYLPTALGKGRIVNDSRPTPSISAFQGIEHIQFTVSAADGDGVRIDGTIGNDLIQFFHDATPGSGIFRGTMDQNNATGVGPFALTETKFLGIDPAANDADVNFFNPGGTDAFEFNGTAGDDVIVVGVGEAGGTQFAATIGGTAYSRLEVFNVASATVNGDAGSDSFDVTPSATVVLNINGGTPAPPTTPGDVLAFRMAGATDPQVSSTATPGGYQGSATFANRHNVNFKEIETGQSDGVAIVTTASASVVVGNGISDSATLSAGFNATGTVTFRLYGPDDANCTGAVAFASTVPVAGTGATSGTLMTSQAGTYRWIASYSGDANNDAVAGVCNAANESVVVTRATPTIATTAVPESGPVGSSVGDVATLAGGYNPTGNVVFALFGPYDATCSAAPAFTSAPVAVNGAGSYASPPAGALRAGLYRWVASYSGDANNDPVTTACGDPRETVEIAATIPALEPLGLALLLAGLAALGALAIRRSA